MVHFETQEPNFNQEWLVTEQTLRGKRRRFQLNDFDAYLAWEKSCNQKINEAYPNENERFKCYLYHVLSGSSPDDRVEYFDFPGEISIQQMIEQLND